MILTSSLHPPPPRAHHQPFQNGMTALQDSHSPCRRCKEPDAPYVLRSLPTCRGCAVDYVESKVVKRLGVLTKHTRASPRPVPRRYLAGLSFGPSSSALAQLLDKTAAYHASRRASSPFEPLVVHVDTDLAPRPPGAGPAEQLLARYRARFPHVAFACVRLTAALRVDTIDWSALPLPILPRDDDDDENDDDEEHDALRLRRLFDALPSASSRADVLRLLVRHVLLHVARQRGQGALLLAHSATALAGLTLAQVAGGRGFAVPGDVGDGHVPLCTYEADAGGGRPAREASRTTFPVYYPMRELLKSEIALYLDLVPALEGLVVPGPSPGGGGTAVVSHRDLSIEEVVARYFDTVEGAHSGIIANVVRITGKLERPEGAELCRLCGTALDEEGDSRWAGELGDLEDAGLGASSNLCYGCKRSIHG